MLVDVVKLWGSSSLEGEKRVGYLKYYGVAHQKLCNVSKNLVQLHTNNGPGAFPYLEVRNYEKV